MFDIFGHKYPYQDAHELNLDWILEQIKKIAETVETFKLDNTITFANPIDWDKSSTYHKSVIVLGSDGDTYISTKTVPAGIDITNTEYWYRLGDYNAQFIKRSIFKNTVSDLISDTSLYVGAYVETLGYRAVNDGGHAKYIIKSTKDDSHHYEDLNNGLFAELLIDDVINVKWLGAYGNLNDGTKDDSVYINDALSLAKITGDKVLLDGDTFTIKTPIVIDSNCQLVGTSRNQTVIYLADNANCNMLESVNFNVLKNGDTSIMEYQPYRITIDNIKFVGNTEHNTSGHGVCLFATASTLSNLYLTDIPENGVYIGLRDAWIPDFETSDIPAKQALVLHDIDIYSCGKHGIYVDGAHDTYYENIVVCNASQKQDNTYDGVHLEDKSGGRFVHYHGWSATQGFRDRYSLYHNDNSPLEISDSHLEGSRTSVLHVKSASVITNTRFYVAYGQHMITVKGNLNSFSNCIFQPSTTRNTLCVELGDTSTMNRFECTITDNVQFTDESSNVGNNAYSLMWWGNYANKEVIEGIKPDSTLHLNCNYTGPLNKPTTILNGNVVVPKQISEGIYVFNDDEAFHSIHSERYIAVVSNVNNKYLSMNSNQQNVGRIVTIRNNTASLLHVYMSTGAIVNGSITGDAYVPADSSKTYLKIGNDEWITY